MSVCLSVCHTAPSNRFFFFVYQWNRAIFCTSVFHVALHKLFFFDFWFRPPNAQNLLSQICNCTKSPITRLVWQIDRRCLRLQGGFRGRPIQWNHVQRCGADPCCHGIEIWANLGYFSTKSPISRLVCQIDRICLGLPGDTPRGPIFVAIATTFALGTESNRLPACITDTCLDIYCKC